MTHSRHHNSSHSAFTLVELIISMTIFMVFIGVVTTTYIFVSRSLRYASEVREVYAEARFLTDRITEDVRLMTIDYRCYEASSVDLIPYGSDFNECVAAEAQLNTTGQSSYLALISADGMHRVIYRFVDDEFSILELTWDESITDWETNEGYYEGFQTFDTDRVVLENVHFTIHPLEDPYDYTNFADERQYQPSVNLLIEAKSRSTVIDEVVQVAMQTTVSSRVYSVNFPDGQEAETPLIELTVPLSLN